MDFFDLAKNRRACHTFVSGKNIPKEDIVTMIEQTALTPSGYNAQPWEFIAIQDEENLKEIQKIAFNQSHVKKAKAVIIVLGDLYIGRHVDALLEDWLKFGYCTKEDVPVYRNSIAKKRSPEKLKDMALRNAMLASMNLIWSAENLGYQTCPMMGFSQHELTTFLNIPEDRVIALMIAIGHGDPKQEKKQLPRKKVEDMLHWEKFGVEK
jgi:putative NAD(P)H nitroreductase